jgi:hypothetical protein
MIVSFCQKHTIRLIAQAQRGFLLFLMVDQGYVVFLLTIKQPFDVDWGPETKFLFSVNK